MFTCVDWLGDGLRVIAETPCRAVHVDSGGRARVIEREYGYDHFVAAAFDPLRQVSRDSPAASIVMLNTIAALASCLSAREHLAALALQAELISIGFDGHAVSRDRENVETAFKRAMQVVTQRGSPDPAIPGNLL